MLQSIERVFNESSIDFVRVSVLISSEVKRLRDSEIGNYISKDQLLLFKKNKKGLMEFYAKDFRGLEYKFGTSVNEVEVDDDFKIAVIPWIENKTLTYANGNETDCIEQLQAIYFLKLPVASVGYGSFKFVYQATGVRDASSKFVNGCSIVIFLLIMIAISYLIC